MHTTPEGLTEADAARLLQAHGPNALPERSRSPWSLVVHQFDDVLVWLLVVAFALALAVPFLEHGRAVVPGHFVDAAVIGGILLLNALLGIAQEYRADRAIAALARMSAPQAVVVRDGTPRSVPSTQVVPGDLLLLEAGDRVAADARIAHSTSLAADESLLTGESVPVPKAVADGPEGLALGGTLVTAGSAHAVVTATGVHTQTGRIAALMHAAEAPDTPLHHQLARLGRLLGGIALAVCAAVLLLGWWRGMPALDLLMVGISLAVSAVPEGLPAVVTVCFALGMRQMAGHRALVRRMDALETLGAVTTIATDKTGTLTANRMTVVEHWTAQPEDRALLARIGLSCNHASGDVGDPTEVALVRFGQAERAERLPIDEELVPFSSESRHMCTRHGEARYWKGAPEALFDLHGDDRTESAFLEAAAEMARRGRRVLAAAEGSPGSLRLVGLWGLEDPPREGATEAIAEAARAGIRTVMITGDHLETARAIADRMGIVGDATAGAATRDLPPGALEQLVRTTSVFGRASPEDKVAICRALQANGEVVAMTGDGVNDAPALRTAHVGVAMGQRGTEVAREAAGMVLADDHYATIVHAVREGRRIHDNIRRFVVFLLRANVDELLLILTAIGAGLPLPYLPVHILWMNLLTDGLPALALAAEPAEPDVMDRPPRDPTAHLLRGETLRLVLASVLSFAGVFALYQWSRGALDDLDQARSLTVTGAVMLELLLAWSARTRGPLCRVPVLGNPWLIGATASVFALHLALLYGPAAPLLHLTPFPGWGWAPAVGMAVGVFAAFEVVKVATRRRV